MKKLVLSLVVISISFNLLNAQTTCLPDGITFTTQSQIDSFQINYPTCSKILGDVNIGAYFTSDVNNLIGLNSIEVIGGRLFIGGTQHLHNLDGLESLDSISGDFVIGSSGEEWSYINDSLNNIDGLVNLSSIGGSLSVSSNPMLENLDGFENLISCAGLLITAGGWPSPMISVLENIEGLSNLTSCGAIHLSYLYNLTSLQGLQNIDPDGLTFIYIRHNNSLSYCEVASVCSHLLNGGGNNILDNALDCNSEEEVLLACASVGVDEVAPKKPFSIYPNPVSKDLYITSDQVPNRYKIYNQLGQVLIEGNEVLNPINISILEAGNYILELSFKDEVYREKIIVY